MTHHLPTDLWNIVLQYKRDMELLECNARATNCFMRHELLPCVYDFPFRILYDYIEARSVYRERLAVWGMFDTVPPPDIDTFPMLL